MSNKVSLSGWHRASMAGILVALILLTLSFAFLSVTPSVGYQKKASAADIAAAGDVISQLTAAQDGGTAVRLSLNARELRAIALMAGETTGAERIEAKVGSGVFTARTSLPLLNGIWINTVATVTGSHTGFPAMHLQVGRVTLPAVVARWSPDLIRWMFLRKGTELPDLDLLVRHFSVGENAVIAELALSGKGDSIRTLVRAAGQPVNEVLASQIFCRLARKSLVAPTTQLAPLVQEAFRGAGGPDPADYNRSAFIAVAFIVVGEQAHALAPSAVETSRSCRPPAQSVVLRGRPDLAKHWAFSAALTAVLGEQTSGSLGEWKELHDSLPLGSGFSFVDLAADRSGFQVARKALNPQSAVRTTQSLQNVTEQRLLPDRLLEGLEGLDEAVFVSSFGGRDESRYREAIRRIDRYLAE
jgi:uncharacterized protein YfiM (DUF2279 family)